MQEGVTQAVVHLDARSPSRDPSQAREECVTGVGHFQPGFSSLESKVVCEQDRLGSQHALVKDAGLVSPSSRAQKPLFAPVIGDCSTPGTLPC